VKSIRSSPVNVSRKAPTGIAGFDDITGGGLPHGRTTLLEGGPGSGKTIFALQFLVHGAQDGKEPGIFVAFEENSGRIVANAESFGWKLAELQPKTLFFLDAQPLPDLVQSGDFDLGGMLAALEVQIHAMGARRIVFDALDMVLTLLPDAAAKRREIFRLHAWLLERELTGIITLKAGGDKSSSLSRQPFGFMQFMVDCAVLLSHGVVLGVSQRSLRVQKYRGSSFDEDEVPFLIGKHGFEVIVARAPGRVDAPATTERVSSGITRLDTMLGRWLLPRRRRADHRLLGNGQDHLERRLRRSGLPARRAHAVRQFRFGLQRGDPQPGLGQHSARSSCGERALADTLGAHHRRQRRGLPGAHQGAGDRTWRPLPGDRSGVDLVEARQ
jgi:circadian clock protein KaiC